jgi:hypothetical protein
VGCVGGGWFQKCVSRQVGDGANTFFWHDLWLGGVPLGVCFGHLFELVVDKYCIVSLMSALAWEEGAEAVVGLVGDVRGVCHITS